MCQWTEQNRFNMGPFLRERMGESHPHGVRIVPQHVHAKELVGGLRENAWMFM